MSADNINAPAHYTAGGIETIDYIRAKLTPEQYKGYCLGNLLKYLSRARLKNGVEDYKKAQVYLQWLVAAEEATNVPEAQPATYAKPYRKDTGSAP